MRGVIEECIWVIVCWCFLFVYYLLFKMFFLMILGGIVIVVIGYSHYPP